MTRHVYFDSHVYDILSDCANRVVYDELSARIRAGELHVYGSISVVEELAALVVDRAEQYARLRDCFWRCVRTDLLLDRALLLQAEMRKSNRLSRREACFPRYFISEKLWAATDAAQQLAALTAEVARRKCTDAENLNSSFGSIEDKIDDLKSTGLLNGHLNIEAEYRNWVRQVGLPEIQLYIDDTRRSAGLSPVPAQSAPCLSAIIAFTVAMAKRNLSADKQWQPSATYDRDHYTYAAAVGTLVTNDRDLIRTVNMIHPPLAIARPVDSFLE